MALTPIFKHCFAPSEVVSSDTASLFGAIAETTVALFYLGFRNKIAFFPLTSDDFQDVGGGVSNVTLYITFLKSKNPTLSTSQLLDLRRRVGGGTRGSFVKVPDLLTDSSTSDEFYEIKPDSASGRVEGTKKITQIGALMGFFSLPYVPGTRWRPNKRVRVFTGPMFGVTVSVFFHFRRSGPGLILYRVCVEGDLDALLAAVIVGAIVLMIVFGPEILAAASAAASAASAAAPVVAGATAAFALFMNIIDGDEQ